jgi:polar amino acid transport system substrate-binding protein
MKRLAVAALVVTLAAATAASALARPTGGGPPTKEPGKLIVGFDLPAPAFWNGQPSGDTITHPTGLEVDLAKAIAAKLGLKQVEYLRAPFTALFTKGPKAFDIAFEEATIRPARERNVDFTIPYFDANQGVLLAKGVAVPKSQDDLKNLQLCSQATTTGLAYIERQIRPEKRPLAFQTLSAAFQAVAIGRCQAIVMDVPLVASEKKQRPTRYGEVAGQIFTHEQYGGVMESGSPLRPAVNKAIAELKASGFIARSARKWLGVPTPLPLLK